MMKTGDALSNALGIENIVEIIPPAAKKLPLVPHQQTVIDAPIEIQVDQDEDYRLARRTFRDLINKGNDAIEGIGDLAKDSESPVFIIITLWCIGCSWPFSYHSSITKSSPG